MSEPEGSGPGWDVTFVTNLAPPYRVPVWEELARSAEVQRLRVALMSRGEPGRHWSNPQPNTWALLQMHSRRVRIGEAHIYIGGRAPDFKRPCGRPVVVVGAWESPAAWQVAARARRAGAILIGFYESTPAAARFRSGLVPRVRTRLLRRLDAVVCAGLGPFDLLVDGGIDPSRLVKTINAVDNEYWAQGDGEPLPTDGAGPVGHQFVIAGQHIPRKNTAAGITAFEKIARDGDLLHVVGSGPLTDELKQLVKSRDIQGVLFHGHLGAASLRALFHRTNTLVLPSERDVWGLVVNEALATGMQVVVADSCGVATEVSSMAGVEVVPSGGDPGDFEHRLASAMDEARTQWTGRIDHPEIFRFSPQRVSSDFLRAFAMGQAGRAFSPRTR